MELLRLQEDRFDEFFELVKAMVKEAEFDAADPSYAKCLELFRSPAVVVIAAEQDGQLIGFISGIVSQYFFSERIKAADLGFFVVPAHRGTSAAIRLISAFEKWADEMGVSEIYLGQTTAVDIEKTIKFYTRLGYRCVGFNTVKHLH